MTHSLSPFVHTVWIEALGLDAAYVPFQPPVDRFLAFVEGLRGAGVVGLNVTAPFKEAAALFADHRAPAALCAGAANLLLYGADGRVEADNTDGEGVVYALGRRAPHLEFGGAAAVLLGAGGAARGAVLALSQAGVKDIRIINRTPARAEILKTIAPGVVVFDVHGRRAAFAGADLVINTIPVAARDHGGDVGLDGLPPGAVALDMAYNPLETAFLRHAAARGCTPVDGLDMLIGQAVPSFTRMFGVAPPPEPDVRALALELLRGRS